MTNSGLEIAQLAIGALMGTIVSVNLDRNGVSIRDPKTRWKALAVISTFLYSFLVLSDLIIS